jgi:hypothetical protein
VDGGGEGFKTKGNGGAWETTEGWRNFAERIDWIVLDDSHFNVVDFLFFLFHFPFRDSFMLFVLFVSLWNVSILCCTSPNVMAVDIVA